MSLHTELSAILRETQHLLKSVSFILATEEDVDYFRSLAKKGIAPLPSPVKIAPTAAPVMKSEPSKVATPVPAAAPVMKSEPPKVATPVPAAAPVMKSEPSKVATPALTAAAPPVEAPSFSALRQVLAQIAPNMPFINEIPSDAAAKKIASRWKTKNQATPISILYGSENPEHKELLSAIARAIDINFGPAHLIAAEPIEKEKNWEAFLSTEHLRWIIVCDSTLWQMTQLMRYYKEIPEQKIRMLGNKALFLLPDLSLYLKDPLLKKSLWKGLCQSLSS